LKPYKRGLANIIKLERWLIKQFKKIARKYGVTQNKCTLKGTHIDGFSDTISHEVSPETISLSHFLDAGASLHLSMDAANIPAHQRAFKEGERHQPSHFSPKF
jgi:hypothetical protein